MNILKVDIDLAALTLAERIRKRGACHVFVRKTGQISAYVLNDKYLKGLPDRDMIGTYDRSASAGMIADDLRAKAMEIHS